MKINALKKVIKEVVREVIQEELKEILLEAVKAPKVVSQPQHVIKENTQIPITTPTPTPQHTMTQKERFESYSNILGQTGKEMFTSQDVQTFNPTPGQGGAKGQLPAGEVNMGQIMGLMNKK